MLQSQLIDQILFFAFFVIVIFAALSDLTRLRIPNQASIALLLLFPLHVLVSPVSVNWIGSLAVAGIVFVVGFALFTRGMVGGGDVKLLTATSLWAGQALVLPELAVMALAGGVLALAVMAIQWARRIRGVGLIGLLVPEANPSRPKVPYGIAIAAGAGYAGLRALAG